MVIITPERRRVLNFDNIDELWLSRDAIFAEFKDNSKVTLAIYDNHEQAEEAFEDMIDFLFPQDEPYNPNKTYYMP